MGDVVIEELLEPTDEYERALGLLVPQLSSAPPPCRDELELLANDAGSRVFFARVDKEIIGMIAIAIFRIPTGTRAIIEDVVVDERARGKGVATALIEHAIETARAGGARSVDLTSRPARVAANRLYQQLGFEQRQTNVYRLSLEGS